MKNIFYAFILINFLFSCRSNNRQTVKDTLTTEPTAGQTNELIKKFKPIVQGNWVKKNYIDKVVEKKSVLAAADEVNDITAMNIDIDSIKKDSLAVVLGWANHDSSEGILKFQQGKNPSSLKFNGGNLEYSINKGDTLLTFSRFDEQKKKTISTTFIRAMIKSPKNDLGYGLSHLINKGLIAGNYIMTDTTGSSSKVAFTNDGKVDGFLNHSTYEINFDLNSDPMDNLDEIRFDRDKNTYSSFSYKITADTLSLYETYPNADSSELILGKRIYKLVKQR
ncbi:MAG TPA: hypothetical protein VIM89_03240 [Mucilaginibacter sp.]